jgi:hypothetical protein
MSRVLAEAPDRQEAPGGMDELVRAIAREEAQAVVAEARLTSASLPSDDDAVDAKEAARMLGYFKNGEPNPWPVYELAKRKIIEAFRPSPGIVRFNVGKLRRFVEAGGCTMDEDMPTEEV